MGAPALLAAWVLSTAPLLVADPGGVSRLGLGLAVWLAIAGLPSAAPRGRPSGGRGAAVLLAPVLALPPLAAAARLDGTLGSRWGALAAAAAWGLLLLVLLAASSRWASTSPARRATHAVAWLVLVPGVPLMIAVTAWVGVDAEWAPAWMRELAGWSPLGWAMDLAAERGRLSPGAAAGEIGPPIGALLVALLLCALGRGRRHGGEATRCR